MSRDAEGKGRDCGKDCGKADTWEQGVAQLTGHNTKVHYLLHEGGHRLDSIQV